MTSTPHQLWDKVEAFLKRFISYPHEHASVAHTLWIAHTHLINEWDTTPRLAFLSAEPASGKSRALEVTSMLVPRPIEAVNSSSAYIVRKVSDKAGIPTILFDEVDAIFGIKNPRGNEDLRSILNAGYRRHSTIGRCTQSKSGQFGTEELPAFAAIALAGLGHLPDTVLSRSIVIRMRRRGPKEHVEPFRKRDEERVASELMSMIESWAAEVAGIGSRISETPSEITDRDADIWESLITLADFIGGDWPRKARVAALHFVCASKELSPSIGIQLLSDIRTVMNERARVTSDELISLLLSLPEAPWARLNGETITQRILASLLKDFDIRPKVLKFEDRQARGYLRAMFEDSWERYLPTPQNA
jgi:hypothetical protein